MNHFRFQHLQVLSDRAGKWSPENRPPNWTERICVVNDQHRTVISTASHVGAPARFARAESAIPRHSSLPSKSRRDIDRGSWTVGADRGAIRAMRQTGTTGSQWNCLPQEWNRNARRKEKMSAGFLDGKISDRLSTRYQQIVRKFEFVAVSALQVLVILTVTQRLERRWRVA